MAQKVLARGLLDFPPLKIELNVLYTTLPYLTHKDTEMQVVGGKVSRKYQCVLALVLHSFLQIRSRTCDVLWLTLWTFAPS